MIAIVSALSRERAALAVLCECRGWATVECDSVRAWRRLLGRRPPKIVLTRHKLGDGYSDDVIAAMDPAGLGPATKIIVLTSADTPAGAEARQVAIGADCVLRDPVRTDVLAAYLTKYYATPPGRTRHPRRVQSKRLRFGGAVFDPTGRTLARGSGSTALTPREVALLEVLLECRGAVASYERLYTDVLGRRFAGDTTNMRVLLGKLAASARNVGIDLRRYVQVIPKTGYRYVMTAARRQSRRAPMRAPLLPAA